MDFMSFSDSNEQSARSEDGVWGIGVTRPLCGIQRDGNRKSQGVLARLCEFPGSSPQAGDLGDEVPHRSPIAKQ